MMKIRLKEREEAVLSTLKIETTFKIRESSFIFMKVDVDGLTVRPKRIDPRPDSEPKPITVLIPEGKTTVTCLSTGKVQFLNLNEKVQIVELECVEIAKEKQVRGKEQFLQQKVKVQTLGAEGAMDESSSL